MRIDCGQIDPSAVTRPIPGEWRPHRPERLYDEELADRRIGRNAVYQLAVLTIGTPRGRRRLAKRAAVGRLNAVSLCRECARSRRQ